MKQAGRLEGYRITLESKETENLSKTKANRKVRKHTERTLNRQTNTKESVLIVAKTDRKGKGHRVKRGYLNHMGLMPREKDKNTALTRKVMLLETVQGYKGDRTLIGFCEKGVWVKPSHVVRRNQRVKGATRTDRTKRLKGTRLNRMKANNVRRRMRLKSQRLTESKGGLDVN